jgi:hypothetical protein
LPRSTGSLLLFKRQEPNTFERSFCEQLRGVEGGSSCVEPRTDGDHGAMTLTQNVMGSPD